MIGRIGYTLGDVDPKHAVANPEMVAVEAQYLLVAVDRIARITLLPQHVAQQVEGIGIALLLLDAELELFPRPVEKAPVVGAQAKAEVLLRKDDRIGRVRLDGN